MRNLEYWVQKKARLETYSKKVILEKYHNFLNVFFEKNLDTFPLYQKYDYKIILKKEQKYDYTLFYKI